MADSLEGLFKHLSGPVAATWAGEREALNNYASEAETAHRQQQIQDLLQAHAQKELTNPLDVANKQLTNRGLEAGLPGITADSRKKTLDAETAAQTQMGEIAATNSKNELGLLEHNIKKNDVLVDLLGKGAASLKTVLPVNRHAVLYENLVMIGGQQALNAFKPQLDKINGDKLPDVMEAFAQHSAMGSVGMRQKLAEIAAKTASEERIARGHDAATRYGVDQRRETAEAIMAAKAEREARAKTLEDDVVRNLNAARAETDVAKQAIYYAQAAQSAKLKAELPGYGKVNSGEVAGMPTNPISPLGPVNTDKAKPLTMAEKRAALAGK